MRFALCLVGVGQTTHATHNSQHVVVGSIHTHLGGLCPFHCGIRQDKLQGSVVDTREVARAARLIFLRAQGKGVHVDALIGRTRVGLVGLHPREVSALTLGEAVLAVELQLGSDHGVEAPAVHVQRGLCEHKGASVGHRRAVKTGLVGEGGEGGHGLGVEARVGQVGGHVAEAAKVGLVHGVVGVGPVASLVRLQGVVEGARVVKHALLVDVLVLASHRLGSAKRVDGVGKRVEGVGVVEGLGAQHLEEHAVAHQGRAVINVLIGLHDPDELLNGVVKVQLNLVGRRAHRLVARELQLRDEVLVGLLGEASALVRVQEHIVDVQRRGDQRLVVGNGGGDRCASLEVGGGAVGRGGATERGDGPQALVDGANVQVDFDFVILHFTKYPTFRYIYGFDCIIFTVGVIVAFAFQHRRLAFNQGIDYILSYHLCGLNTSNPIPFSR